MKQKNYIRIFSLIILGNFSFLPAYGFTVVNPLATGTILDVINNIIDFLQLVLSPLAVLVILYAAFVLMTSGGSEEKIKKGKLIIIWAIVGVVVLLVANSIIGFVQSFFP